LIFVDTNVVSETLRKAPDPAVLAWLVRHDAELALPTVTIAEIAFGIRKIHPDQRVGRLEEGLAEWRRRFADRIFWTDRNRRHGLWRRHGQRCPAGTGYVCARRYDRGDREGKWGPSCDAKPRRFLNHGAGFDIPMGLLDVRLRLA
jgi:predicted nucleic acid-binding protein